MFGDYDSENDCQTKTMEAGALDNKRMRIISNSESRSRGAPHDA